MSGDLVVRQAKPAEADGQVAKRRAVRTALAHVLPIATAVTVTALVTSAVQPVLVSDQSPRAQDVNRSWVPETYRGTLKDGLAALLAPLEHLLGAHATPDAQWRSPSVPDVSSKTRVVSADYVGGRRIQLAATSGAATSAGQGLVPWETFDNLSLTTDTDAIVDQGNGNLILKSTDQALNAVGVPLSVDRYFNSVTADPGSLGGQWSTPLSGFDTGLYNGTTNRYYVAPSGNVERFSPDGAGGWTQPPSFNATLTTSASAATLVLNDTGETLSFNGSGWITSDVDNNGLGNTYTYNAAGQVTKVTETTGKFFNLSWSSTTPSFVTSITDSANRTTTYTHDAAGRLTRVDSPGGYWETYAYNAAGLVSEIQAVGPTSTISALIDFTYDSSDRILSISQGAVGSSSYSRTTTYSGWGASGTVTITDGNGHVSLRGISASQAPISLTDANGRKSSWTHNSNGDVTSFTAPGATATTTFAYNSQTSLTSATFPSGASTSATYGSVSGCTGSGGTIFNPHCTTDASGRRTAFKWDSHGNLLQTSDITAGGTGANGTTYTYASASGGCYTTVENGVTVVHGLAGQICSSTSGNGKTTTFEYDAAGNQTAVNPPAPLGRSTSTYDSLGRVTSTTDGNGATTTFAYNVLDQLTSTSYAGGAVLTSTWTPNGLQAGTSIDSNNKDTFTYDVLGQLTGETTRHNGVSRVLSYTYDNAGNLTAYSDPYGVVSYVYDDANQLTQLVEPGGACASGVPAASSGCVKFEYDQLGNEVTRTFPGGANVVTARDSSGRPTRITAKTGSGTTVFDKGYSYALNGADTQDIQATTSYVETGVPAGATTSYSYDSLDRLTGAVETASGSTNASWLYAYDADGNRTQQVLTGAVGTAAGAPATGTTSYSYNDADELTHTSGDASTWTYDADGQQTRSGLTGLASGYNDRTGATSFGSGTYVTYADGNDPTYSRVDGSTSTTYTNSSTMGLMGEDYGNQRIYDRTPDGVAIGSRLSAGSRYYYVEDAIGSVVGLFAKDGTYYGGYTYGPYGEARFAGADAALSNNHLRYIAGYFDTSNGTYRLGARYYDASVGRFTQPDPQPGGNENDYNYPDNPINSIDDSGDSSRDGLYWSYNPWAAAAAYAESARQAANAIARAQQATRDAIYGAANAIGNAAKAVGRWFAHNNGDGAKNANREGHRGKKNDDTHSKAQGHGGGKYLKPNPNKRNNFRGDNGRRK